MQWNKFTCMMEIEHREHKSVQNQAHLPLGSFLFITGQTSGQTALLTFSGKKLFTHFGGIGNTSSILSLDCLKTIECMPPLQSSVQYIFYVYKAEKPSVCLSVRHANNSPGTAYINLSTAHHHKTIILPLQVVTAS